MAKSDKANKAAGNKAAGNKAAGNKATKAEHGKASKVEDHKATKAERKKATQEEAEQKFAEKQHKKAEKKAAKEQAADDQARAVLAGPLNKDVEFAAKANAFMNPLLPKAGMIFVGDNGVEYKAFDSPGFVQIPWVNIDYVRADVYGKKHPYVRSIDICTDDGNAYTFVISKGLETLKAMRKHLPGDKMVHATSNLKKLKDKPFWKRGLRKKDKGEKSRKLQ